MSDSYHYFRIRADARDATQLLPRLLARTQPAWAESGAGCWGIWQGLFGISSNELLVMAAAPGSRSLAALAEDLPETAVLEDTLALEATVRPERIAPPPEAGLFVFRFFDVRLEDCDEIVALSLQAWETFETSEAYRSRPLGLFRPPADDAQWPLGRMLLVTWYDGFDSWQTSRTPAPEARENFRRRHALTGGTVAYAVRRVAG
ncbi:MAG: hypothetical protein RIC56_18690 [Pseudomonadales bacterium]